MKSRHPRATDEFGNRRPLTEGEAGLASGAAARAAAGSMRGDAGKMALIGLVAGTIAGRLLGSCRERRRRDFAHALADEIARGAVPVAPPASNNERLVGMTSATSFAVASRRVRPGCYGTLDLIAAIVNRYGQTKSFIAGHADSGGSAAHNLDLSRRRSGAIRAAPG